ncbi:hypothetical protein GXP67_22195 [Rhodocytophaga rosea]|uniref:Uncharacterized protein n=1 Tax=Rhodocytophaga rosea TaxID=2704465 RepID=A0A6C0GMB6_9BACT|nr:hypothetical protein [Rhodocytophaga rosea]QHT69159.1 hypothetical protein GXP67_22195 [Rhodocytophaga rosea]
MTKQLIKPILIGTLAGAALFVMPFFLLRALLFFLIIGALFRLFRGRRYWGWRGGRFGGFHPAFADTIRNMSEEEYRAFRQKFNAPCYPAPRRPEEKIQINTPH